MVFYPAINTKTEAAVGEAIELKSFVPQLCRERQWSEDEFRGRCIMAGFSWRTADRLLAGETNVTISTLAILTKIVFELDDIGKVMNI